MSFKERNIFLFLALRFHLFIRSILFSRWSRKLLSPTTVDHFRFCVGEVTEIEKTVSTSHRCNFNEVSVLGTTQALFPFFWQKLKIKLSRGINCVKPLFEFVFFLLFYIYLDFCFVFKKRNVFLFIALRFHSFIRSTLFSRWSR